MPLQRNRIHIILINKVWFLFFFSPDLCANYKKILRDFLEAAFLFPWSPDFSLLTHFLWWCSTETLSVCSLRMFFDFFFLECDAFRFQPLLSAVRSTSRTSEHVCLTLLSSWRGHVFIFNLTATLLFLDMLVQMIWPPALFRLFKRGKKERKERSWLGPVCVFSVCIN